MRPDQEDHGRAPEHIPVLLHEVLEFLNLQPGLTVVDGTVGSAGHAMEISERIQPAGTLIGLDRDPEALARSAERLRGVPCELRHASYSDLGAVLAELGREQVDRVLIDLGLSSDQLADESRGFSFESDGRLDMRFDPSTATDAAEVVNRWSESRLADVFHDYGEERYARRIARRIVQNRPIRSARALADLIARCVPHERRRGGRRRIHPATRVFQALRIVVNQELEHLHTFLYRELPRHLAPEGRVVVLSFHSLEDRMVKQAFRQRDVWNNLTKKPVTASDAEARTNPRSRSAKLRAAVRLPGSPNGR
jgi:16S rRNA (cytosine1402-N4)-methyltransferase